MLLQRLLTVVIGAPFVIGTILCPETNVFKAFSLICLVFGLREFLAIVGHPKPERRFAVLLGILHMSYLLFCPDRGLMDLREVAFVVIVAFTFYCFYPVENRSGIAQRLALTLLGIFYVATFGSFVGMARDLPHGAYWVFTLLAMTWLNDTAAYFFGHHFGRRRLAPLISPGKTVEGFLGGFVGSFIGFLFFWWIMQNTLTIWEGVLLTLMVGVVGPLGDLSESLIKRSFGVKDSGTLIPGHGGMLDRIDALLFTAPVVYWFAISGG